MSEYDPRPMDGHGASPPGPDDAPPGDDAAGGPTSPGAVTPFQRHASHAPQQFTPAQSCGYCGARLNPFFYFCTSCGTPYKDLSAVISPDIPRQLTEGELVRMKAPNVWPLFWTYACVLVAAAIVASFVYLDKEPMWAMGIQLGALFITTCVFGVMYWPTLAIQFTKPGFFHWAAWAGLGLLAPTLAVNYAWHAMIEQLVRDMDVPDAMAELKEEFAMGFLIFAICVFPAVVEEIAFRGLIQHWLQAALRPWRAIVLASFLFAIMHGPVVLSWPYLFGVGVLLGWTKWKTNSLYPCMLIHFLHNFVVIVYFT